MKQYNQHPTKPARPWTMAVLVIGIASALMFSCASEKAANANFSSEKVADEDLAPVAQGGVKSKYAKKSKKDVKANVGSDDQLQISDYDPAQFAGKKRLIEHTVNLRFEVDSVSLTRAELLELTKGKGFVQSANTGNEGKDFATSGYIRYVAHIRSKDLYQFLQDVGRIGRLQSENIRTTDHTAAFKKEELKTEMLNRRIARQNLLGQTSGPKNAVQAEQVLVKSEDAALNAQYEQWRITDRVRWAQVDVYAHLPRTAGWDVPDYREGFKGLVEGALYLLYSLIYIIPILVLLFGAWQGFRYVRRRFSD